ncbi:FAD-binding oxidoreductase [Lentzea sp. NPDC034063]|uniref:NAD(P)/FAD-dependent oxidoreductase n=1 Tax=unclassified Lentzea TaxID=2643253 RepID=UPI0033E9E734
MTTTAEKSLWLAALPATARAPLTGAHSFDVAVVGGGITGLTTALLLKRRGLRVVVLEADRVASGASGNNTAKVTALQSTVYSRIRSTHGLAAATDYATASLAAVAQVAELATGISCDLRRAPAVTYAYTESEVRDVDHELITARQVGLPVRAIGDVGLPFEVHAAVRLDDQIALHPVKYLRGLADAIDGDGSLVCEHSRVLDVSGHRVSTADGRVTAEKIVIATHYPVLDRGLYFPRLELTRAYCVAARVSTPPQALAISTGSPSWSISAHEDKLILAGQSHPTGKPVVEPFRRLEDFARKHWQVEEITHRWSAQDPTSYDHLSDDRELYAGQHHAVHRHRLHEVGPDQRHVRRGTARGPGHGQAERPGRPVQPAPGVAEVVAHADEEERRGRAGDGRRPRAAGRRHLQRRPAARPGPRRPRRPGQDGRLPRRRR